MSKGSVHKLLVTLAELNWISATVAKKAQLAQKPELKVKPRLRDMLVKLNDKLTELPLPEPDGIHYVLNTNRNEIKALKEMATNDHAALVATVIPGYDEKAKKATPEDRIRFLEYHNKAVTKAHMLNELRNKIERLL